MDARSGQAQYERQQRRIAARRARNEERRQRFLNAKERTLGVDREALDAQVAEKREREEAERLASAMYAQQQAEIRNLIELNIIKERTDAQNEAMQVAAAVRIQRDPTLRREFDLNDKDALKKDLAPRVGDNDPRLGPSSIQIFAGEDLKKGDRVKMQAMQLRDWTDQIRAEKDAEIAAREQANMDEAEMIRQIVTLGREIEAKEADDKLAEEIHTANTNLQLAEDKRFRESRRKQSEDDRGRAEVLRLTNSSWLNEKRSEGLDRYGRPRRDNWKGMDVAELDGILQERQEQLNAKRARQDLMRRKDQDYYLYQQAVLDATQRMSQNELDEQEQRMRDIRVEQARQVVEKRVRDAIEKKERMGSVGADFYKGFGSSCR